MTPLHVRRLCRRTFAFRSPLINRRGKNVISPRMFVRPLFLCFGILAIGTLGCGSTAPKNPIVQVEGKALAADGKAVPTGSLIIFEPMEGNVAPAQASIEEGGVFKLKHSSGVPGAETGRYTVTVRPVADNKEAFKKAIGKDEYVITFEVKDAMGPIEIKPK